MKSLIRGGVSLEYVKHISTDQEDAVRRNLTLAIDDEILRLARIVAARREKTLTGLVREFLLSLASSDRERGASLRRLRKIMDARPLAVGRVKWTREDLHAR